MKVAKKQWEVEFIGLPYQFLFKVVKWDVFDVRPGILEKQIFRKF